jgi:hypothetical protein
MEPQKSAKSVDSRGERQTSQPRQPERKRRFQIVKLEERIAPAAAYPHGPTSCRKCYGTAQTGRF